MMELFAFAVIAGTVVCPPLACWFVLKGLVEIDRSLGGSETERSLDVHIVIDGIPAPDSQAEAHD